MPSARPRQETEHDRQPHRPGDRPHPDDEVLGAGATIARLVDACFGVTVVAMCSDLPPLYPADVAPTVEAEAAFEASMVVTRPRGTGTGMSVVAMYETMSETYWNAPGAEPQFMPTWNVDVTATIDRKIEAFDIYESQHQPYPGPRSTEAMRARALFRGSQAGMEYAECFQIVRMSTGRGAEALKALG